MAGNLNAVARGLGSACGLALSAVIRQSEWRFPEVPNPRAGNFEDFPRWPIRVPGAPRG